MYIATFSIICTEDGHYTADQEPPLPRLITFKEAITVLEDVAHYYKGLGDAALFVASNVDKIADIQHPTECVTTLFSS